MKKDRRWWRSAPSKENIETRNQFLKPNKSKRTDGGYNYENE